MEPDDWRARITTLAGGDTLEAMLTFAARQAGATGGHRRRGYRAKVSRADVARTTERAHPTDPAEALARALLAAGTGSTR